MATHSTLTGLDLHEPYHFVQESDPGAVGANLYWLKISTGVISRRNPANSGWSLVGGGDLAFTGLNDVPSDYAGHGNKFVVVNPAETGLIFDTPVIVATLPDWLGIHPDASPASPNALDDEFNVTGSLPVAWTWQNQGTATAALAKSRLGLTILADASLTIKSILQTAPATPWTVTAQISINCKTPANFVKGGLMLRDSSSKLFFYGLQFSTTLGVALVKFTNDTTFSSNVNSHNTLHNSIYLRITDNGTNTIFSYSYDGNSFIQQFSESRTTFFASGPTQVGIGGATQQASTDLIICSDWFRVT